MRLSLLLPALLLASFASLPAVAGAAGPARGDLAPGMLGDSGGRPVLLSDYRGKIVVVAFWTASCTPCREQMGAFEELNKQYSPLGLQVIGVDVGDDTREYSSLLRKVRHPTMVLAHDQSNAVGEAWGVYMLPNVWIVGPDGRVLSHHDGYVAADLPAIFEEVRGFVAANQAPAAAAPGAGASSP
jgi:peroxiredoxin